jgi:hypothetical protein
VSHTPLHTTQKPHSSWTKTCVCVCVCVCGRAGVKYNIMRTRLLLMMYIHTHTHTIQHTPHTHTHTHTHSLSHLFSVGCNETLDVPSNPQPKTLNSSLQPTYTANITFHKATYNFTKPFDHAHTSRCLSLKNWTQLLSGNFL